MVLFEIVKGVISELRHCNCEACQTSPPVTGQKGHMKAGGCLDPENESSEGYIEQAWGMMHVSDLVAVYNTVCQFLGVSPQGSTLLAKAALTWISPEGIVDAIEEGVVLTTSQPADMDEMLLQVNSPLLDLVRNVCVDLGVKQKIIWNHYNNGTV